jgi:hypothetical protein
VIRRSEMGKLADRNSAVSALVSPVNSNEGIQQILGNEKEKNVVMVWANE